MPLGGIRVHIVIATQHQQRSRVERPQCLCHVGHIARVKGHGDGVAGGLVQAGSGGVALCQQQHGGGFIKHTLNTAHQVPQARLAPALGKQLVGAVLRPLWGYALHVPQLARAIAQGHQQSAIRGKAHAVGLHTLAGQVGAGAVAARVAGCIPQRGRFSGGMGVFGLLLGLLCLLALCLFTRTLCQCFGAGWCGGLVWLGQAEAVFFGQA